MAGYQDIYSTDPNGLNMGIPMPTVNQQAAVANAGVANAPVGMGQTNTNGFQAPTIPDVGAQVGAKPGFFSQNGAGGFALGAIQVLGNLWNSFQQNKMAKKAFNFQKKAYETNLKNQTQTYNTELQDRINARYVTEGRADVQGDVNDYVAKNKL